MTSGPLAHRIRDLGNSHYELLDLDRHDRIDRYSD
jgi:hypothetical protein